jgi:hypothetical protein
MLDFVSSETKKIMYNCIERESKLMQIPLEKTRLVLYLNEDGTNGYRTIEEFINGDGAVDVRTLKEFSFTGVLGVKIDMRGYSLIAPPFIQKAILRFSENLKIPYTNLNVVCYPTYKKGEIAICIFNGKAYVQQIQLSELFNEQDAVQNT